jgi:hypothetical protein
MIRLVEPHRLEGQLTYLHHLRLQMQNLSAQVAGWQKTLDELVERLLVAEAEFMRQQQANQPVVVESIVQPEEIEQFYDDGKTAGLELLMQGMRLRWWPTKHEFGLEYTTTDQATTERWKVLSPEGIARHVSYCRHAWDGLRELSIEQILADRGEDPMVMATELEQNAVPWVAVSEVKQIPAEQKLLLLATEKGETGFWRGYAAKLGHVNFVPTGDKTKMVFLYTAHALDVFNLRQAAAWDPAYEQAIKEGKPLHVVPELDPWGKPSSERETDGEMAERQTIEPAGSEELIIEETKTVEKAKEVKYVTE